MKLREYEVAFARGSRSRDPNRHDLGLRSKLGGDPEWDQGDETPNCSSCNAAMTFVGQIDSIEHDFPNNPHAVEALSGEQHFMFGDVGMIYIFFCFQCSETKSVFQCG